MKRMFFAGLLVVLTLCFLGYLLYDAYYTPFKVQIIRTDVIVTDERVVGFNLDKDAMHFGMFRPDQGVTRKMNVSNDMDRSVRVEISKDYSEISDWTVISDTKFNLEPDSFKDVTIYCQIPQDAKNQTYNGTIFLSYYHVWP